MNYSTMITTVTWLLLTAGAQAQGLPPQKPKGMADWKFDKLYTRNDPERMTKAGYLNYGPFTFGDTGTRPVDTKLIDEHLHYAKIRWVETEHFRIGCSLASWPVPNDLPTRNKIREELERLKLKIPQVNPRTRMLDEWLRLHLTAQRLEELYTELSADFGVKDADFGKPWIAGERYMGVGKYLGMGDKYLMLVTEKANTYLDYLQTFVGKVSKFGQRWHFKKVGSLFYGIGADLEQSCRHDTGLHGNLVFNAAINLTDGFRHYSYDLPVWIREAIGHHYNRKVAEKWNNFDQDEGVRMVPKSTWKWKSYTRRLITSDKCTPLAKVQTWRQYSDIGFDDHVLIWSRFDYMLSLGRDKFSKFMFEIKGRIDPKTNLVDQRDLVGAVRDALQKVYGMTVFTFDSKWKEWVQETYPVME